MTGYRSRFFRHQCQRDGCYVAQLPDWADLIDCFPRGIRPTDIDGMVEINGHLLFLEEKHEGACPNAGQAQAMRTLATHPRVTVVFFRPGTRSDFDVLIYGQGDPTGWQPWTRTDFLDWLRAWATEADRTAA